MNIQIIGDNLELSQYTKKLIDQKINLRLEKLLSKFSADTKIASIRIQKSKLKEYLINFDMNLPGKKHIYAETHHRILKSALIDLEQEVEKQIKKYKQELVNYSLSS